MPVIRIDMEVYVALNEMGKTEDTFDSVLRRLLGLSQKVRGNIHKEHLKSEFSENGFSMMDREVPLEDDEIISDILFEVIDIHLPAHWASSPKRGRQILMVVYGVLSQDFSSPIEDRHQRAAAAVAEKFGISRETVHDKCMRQLFGNGSGLSERFRDALLEIEKDYWARIAAIEEQSGVSSVHLRYPLSEDVTL